LKNKKTKSTGLASLPCDLQSYAFGFLMVVLFFFYFKLRGWKFD
jgi:hypothetical protein